MSAPTLTTATTTLPLFLTEFDSRALDITHTDHDGQLCNNCGYEDAPAAAQLLNLDHGDGLFDLPVCAECAPSVITDESGYTTRLEIELFH